MTHKYYGVYGRKSIKNWTLRFLLIPSFLWLSIFIMGLLLEGVIARAASQPIPVQNETGYNVPSKHGQARKMIHYRCSCFLNNPSCFVSLQLSYCYNNCLLHLSPLKISLKLPFLFADKDDPVHTQCQNPGSRPYRAQAASWYSLTSSWRYIYLILFIFVLFIRVYIYLREVVQLDVDLKVAGSIPG